MTGFMLWLAVGASAGELPKKFGKEREKLCVRGDIGACIELTEFILDRGIAKYGQGPAAALPWARRACDRGDVHGCYLRGRAMEGSVEFRRLLDGRRIMKWYSDACDAGVKGSCAELYRFLQEWESVIKLESDEADFLVSMACEAGVTEACAKERPAEMVGKLTKAGITGILRDASDQVGACGDEGSVSATFTIDDAGAVSAVDLASDDVTDPLVLGCIESALQQLRFPKPDHGTVQVSFTYPL